MEDATGTQNSGHLGQDTIWILHVFEHIEDPYEVELAIPEGQLLRSCQSKMDAFGAPSYQCESGFAQVATEHLKIRPLPFYRLRDRTGTATHV